VSEGAKWVVERNDWWREVSGGAKSMGREIIGEARWVGEQFQFHLIEVVNGRPDRHLRCFSETHRMRLKAPLKRSQIGGSES
jgi:hypothetical protein